VRLVNGPNNCSGRVEVLYSGQWGSVCDDGWDLLGATAVCRRLACGEALEAPHQAWFGQGSGPVFLTDMLYYGTEGSFQEHSGSGQGVHNCSHDEDAGVICTGQWTQEDEFDWWKGVTLLNDLVEAAQR